MSERKPVHVPDYIVELRPYQPGKPIEVVERELGITGAVKVASNENPMGPSPRAIAAGADAMGSVHLYPDGGCFELRDRLAGVHGIHSSELIFGAGSNELIHLLVQATCTAGKDRVVTHENAFISYRLAAISRGVEFVATAITADLECDIDAMIAAITPETKLVFLANPNNPTGAYVGRSDFERLLVSLPPTVVLVVDEAYFEYASRAADDYPDSLEYRQQAACRVVTLRTFSKAHGLAGLRVGYGVCDPDIANIIDRVRRPFNVSIPAQRAAVAALGDTAHVEESSRLAREGIAKISQTMSTLGLKAYPSVTNFVLVDIARDIKVAEHELAKRGVIVRPMTAWGLPTCLRISIAKPAELEKVCAELADYLA